MDQNTKGLQSRKIVQINFVVEDLYRIKESWGQLLNGSKVYEYTLPSSDLVPIYTDGMMEECDDVKTVKYVLDDHVVLAFWMPGEKDNPWKRHLEKNGESFMNIEFVVDDLIQTYDLLKEVCNVEKPYHFGLYPDFIYSFADTKEILATDLNIGMKGDWKQCRDLWLSENKEEGNDDEDL